MFLSHRHPGTNKVYKRFLWCLLSSTGLHFAYATGNPDELVAITVDFKVKVLDQTPNLETQQFFFWLDVCSDLGTAAPWDEPPTKTAILRLLPLIRRAGRLTVFNVLRAHIGNWEQAGTREGGSSLVSPLHYCVREQTNIEAAVLKRPAGYKGSAWPATPPTNLDLAVKGPHEVSLVLRFWRDDATSHQVLRNIVLERCYVANPSLHVYRWFLHDHGMDGWGVSPHILCTNNQQYPPRVLAPLHLKAFGCVSRWEHWLADVPDKATEHTIQALQATYTSHQCADRWIHPDGVFVTAPASQVAATTENVDDDDDDESSLPYVVLCARG